MFKAVSFLVSIGLVLAWSGIVGLLVMLVEGADNLIAALAAPVLSDGIGGWLTWAIDLAGDFGQGLLILIWLLGAYMILRPERWLPFARA
jgi:hypothetical protein